MLNDPYHGGTHLPDITVVTPVFLGPARAPCFYVASRGHHADIGGITPGSMPPFSATHRRGGRAASTTSSCRRGRPICARRSCCALLGGGPYPARNPAQNLADLRAQIAANEKGAPGARAVMAALRRCDTVASYMRHVQDNAEECVRRAIGALQDGEFALRAGQRRADSGQRAGGCRHGAARASISPAPAPSSRTTSTRRADHGGRRAVRVPHPGRRRHSAQRRLPEAAGTSSFRRARMLNPRRRRRWWPATSRPRPA